MIGAEDAIEIYQRLNSEGIQVWLTGGWGIDALLHNQTRLHKDLDIIVLFDDVIRLREIFSNDGYQLVKIWEENIWVRDGSGEEIPTAFVVQDPEDRQIDVHAMQMDDQGNGIPMWENEDGRIFEKMDLAGDGSISGIKVRCITPQMQLICHTGYHMPDYQVRDIELLCQRFGIAYPGE